LKERVSRFFPILDWTHHYSKELLSGDLTAGLTIGVMLIPQGMAYALIAGLPPVYGLYAAITPQIIYAILGTSRQLAVGAVAMDSLLVAVGVSTLAEEGTDVYISYAILLAFMVGVVQLVLGFLRMGFVTNLLAKPVISGFTSAAAIIIALGQIKHLLGYEVVRNSNTFLVLSDTVSRLGTTNWLSLCLGVGGFLLMFLLKKTKSKVPGAPVALVLGILIVGALQLQNLGVKIVGDIPAGLPTFTMPNLEWVRIIALVPLAVTIAIVSFVEAFSLAKSIEMKKRDHYVVPNQELKALGAANLIGSLFQSFPTTGGFSRSAVNYQIGGNTQLVSFISAGIVAVTLLFLTPLFYYLPKAILGAIILMSVVSLVDSKYTLSLWKKNKAEFVVLIATSTITLAFGMVPGIASGVILSVLLLIYRLGYPHIAQLGRVPGNNEFRNVKRFEDLESWPSLLILRLDGPLTFVNIQYFKDYVLKSLNTKEGIKALLLDAGPISQIDATAILGMEDLLLTLTEQKIKFYMADVVGPVRDQLHRSGLINTIGVDNIFMNLNDVIDFHVDHKKNEYQQASIQTGELK